MTREAELLIEMWNILHRECHRVVTEENYDVIKKAIKALEQEPCEDAISRQAVQIELKNCEVIDVRDENDNLIGYYNADTVDSIVRNLPSVTPKQRTGHWIIKDGKEQGYDIGGVKTWYIQMMCDKCGFIKSAIEGHIGQYHFCPNCGARMESEEQA